jgi:hypothetical protein
MSRLALVILMTLLSGVKNSEWRESSSGGHRGAASYGQAVAGRVTDPVDYIAV